MAVPLVVSGIYMPFAVPKRSVQLDVNVAPKARPKDL